MVDNWKLCFNKYSNNCVVKFDFFKTTVNGDVQFKVVKKKKYVFKTRLKINRIFRFKIMYRKINILLERRFPVNIINGEAYISENQLNNFIKFYVSLGPIYRRISKIKPIVRNVLPDFI